MTDTKTRKAKILRDSKPLEATVDEFQPGDVFRTTNGPKAEYLGDVTEGSNTIASYLSRKGEDITIAGTQKENLIPNDSGLIHIHPSQHFRILRINRQNTLYEALDSELRISNIR